MKKKLKNTAAVRSITVKTKIADLLQSYPDALEVLIESGFEPLRNAATRGIAAKFFTLEQAAGFRGMNPNVLLANIKKAVGVAMCDHEHCDHDNCDRENCDHHDDHENEDHEHQSDGPVPELRGDTTFLGLVPCPIRSVLVDSFNAFSQKLTAATGSTIAWWMAGEGPGVEDVRNWLGQLIKAGKYDEIPDLMMGVGTEGFLQTRYGRAPYDEGIWEGVRFDDDHLSQLSALEDPQGRLTLQFAVLFVFCCRPDRLPPGASPRCWADLARPELKGQIAFPSLDLPAVPDLLGGLHRHLGEEKFRNLASNVAAELHPAQASPRTGARDVPGVVILPHHFAKMATASGAELIIPEDGPAAVPGYLAVKSNAGEAALSIARYLTSRDFLEPFWRLGGFVPNRSDISTDIEFDTLITMPWDSLHGNDLDETSDRLIEMARRGDSS